MQFQSSVLIRGLSTEVLSKCPILSDYGTTELQDIRTTGQQDNRTTGLYVPCICRE